jgi:hypothetical protein
MSWLVSILKVVLLKIIVVPVVHDDKELEVRVLLAEVDQCRRLAGSGKGHDLDDVAGLRIQRMMNNPEIQFNFTLFNYLSPFSVDLS